MSNFSIFCPSVKKNLFGSGQKVPGSEAGRPLIYCGSKVSSGSGQGPSLHNTLIRQMPVRRLPNVCSSNGRFAYYISFPSLTHAHSVRKGEHETCPAGIGRRKHARKVGKGETCLRGGLVRSG